MTELSYKIVVPSRKRSPNMPLIRQLLPTALVSVNESEVEEYANFVPRKMILPHPEMLGATYVLNWLQEEIQEDVLVIVPDDFRGIKVLTGNNRFIRDPEEILGVLENSTQVITDLDLTVFCYTRTPNTTIIDIDRKPLTPVQTIITSGYGLRGAARNRRFDTTMTGRADMDFALQTYLEDRLVYADHRFYFDCGRIFSGTGGNAGLLTPEQFKRSSLALKAKWGRYITFSAPAFSKNRSVDAVGIRVKRHNPSAQR